MSERLVILGAGESGVGAALLGKKLGMDVFVSDKGMIKDIYKQELEDNQIIWEESMHTEDLIFNANQVVKSPGIPDHIELIKELHSQNIPVISEIEFASRHTNAELIAITGSNGKTTTTSLTYNMFKRAGLNVGLAGNIGYSFARQVAQEDYTHYVLEVSSFQLDGIVNFKPKVAILLNVTPDHLDRYNYSFEEYIQSKLKITQNQTSEDYFIYNGDDENITTRTNQGVTKAQTLAFHLTRKQGSTGWTDEEHLLINHKNSQFTMSINDLGLRGSHNKYNSLAAGIAARIFDIRKDVIRESLTDFKGLEHRLEFVSKVKGVEYINDSKATNVNSTWFAMESMTKPVIWIAGGVDKGNDYEVLVPLVRKHVKAIVCMGVDNLKIHEAFSKHVDLIVNTGGAQEAVKVSHHFADDGDAVLLSPACASFDLFDNYEDRGNQFKLAVREL